MRRITYKFLALLLVIIFSPNIVQAESFQTGDHLFFNAKSALFRQKLNKQSWQKVEVPSSYRIEELIEFSNKNVLRISNGTDEQIFVNDLPLRFQPLIEIGIATKLTLRQLGEKLYVLAEYPTDTKLFVINSSWQISEPSGLEFADSTEFGRIQAIGSQTVAVLQRQDLVGIYLLEDNWRFITSFECLNSQLSDKPLLLLNCGNRFLLHPISVSDWQQLVTPVSSRYFYGDKILIGIDNFSSSIVHIWNQGTISTVDLSGFEISPDCQALIIDERVFFKRLNDNWRELMWRADPPELLELLGSSTSEIIQVADSQSLMLNGSSPRLSSLAGNWQPISVQSQFNHAYSTNLGTLIYQLSANTGSFTQFAPTGSSAFIKVNPWSSTTSPITAVNISPTESFISVVTQSGNGNVNLYRTENFVNWSRITLPTAVTYGVDITQARSLPAGNLVEISGVLTVPPGIVDDEVIYLDDGHSGIQIFLSRTKGVLPDRTQISVIATGEISSSQVKRIVLDSLGDLQLSVNQTRNPTTIIPSQIEQFVGRLVSLKATVKKLSTDYFEVSNGTALLKVKYPGVKDLFLSEDQIAVDTVIDWNSSSGQTEAWAWPSKYQILFRPPISQTIVASEQAAPKAVQVAKPSASKSIPAPVATKTTASVPLVRKVVATTTEPSQALVAGMSSTDNSLDLRTIVILGLLSLTAGLISLTGRRFRILINR